LPPGHFLYVVGDEETESQTRKIKKLRMKVAKTGEAVLDDVNFDADVKRREVLARLLRQRSGDNFNRPFRT